MKLDVYADEEAVARAAAVLIAAEARGAIRERGRFVFAVSGGRTPWTMLALLAGETLPWERIHIAQVDERVAPADNPDRNLGHLRESLIDRVGIAPDHVHAMPVEDADLDGAAWRYAQELERVAGSSPVLDLVHLGLGPDGHTASLVPGDAALDVTDADVATTQAYQGRRRMTLTFPALNRARRVMFVVTRADKADALERLLACDPNIPASHVARENALVLADRAAASQISPVASRNGGEDPER